MKLKSVLTLLVLSASNYASAFTYLTGNIHTNSHMAEKYSFEIGHIFESKTHVYSELSSGRVTDKYGAPNAESLIGLEQYALGDFSSYIKPGIQLFNSAGERQLRPLVRFQYTFDNGLYLYQRTRLHLDNDYRRVANQYDNSLGYKFNKYDFRVSHNLRDARVDTSSYNSTEFKITRSGKKLDLYLEYRHQQINAVDFKNDALIFGFVMPITGR